jgi:polar amino acid transport system ATP-binding protein
VADVLNLVRGLAETGMTMILATHEMSFARGRQDLLPDAGVICEGPPGRSSRHQRAAPVSSWRVIEAGRL